jgi:uncharacterized membrane protein
MKPISNTPRQDSHIFTWAVFIGVLLLAALFVNLTVGNLPRLVAVHFDAAGLPTSYMAASRYRLFILLFAVVLPIGLVVFITRAYSRAKEMKLPNRDYWLAPQRIARTRSFLVAHGIWFGSLLVGFMCFMHWLVLDANRRLPPQISNQAVFSGLFVMLGCMMAWIATLMVVFRRPTGA